MSPHDCLDTHRRIPTPTSLTPDDGKKPISLVKASSCSRASSTCSTVTSSNHNNARSVELEENRRGNRTAATTTATAVKQDRPLKLWSLEIACIAISISALLVIVTVLNSFDDQPLPKLPMNITLNTFLAFFTTFTKASLMYPVVQCISQWKWNWFATSDQRPLTDFHTFDNASRGIIGSLALLRLLKWRHIAAVGAIISLIGIATTPVTQLLIEYPSRLVPIAPDTSPELPNATIGAVEHYRSRVGLTGSWSLDVANYVSSGLVHPTDSAIPELSPSCPSGTCTWEPFESLALCAKVANITDQLVIKQVPFSTLDDWTAWDSTIDQDKLRLNGTLAYNISFSSPNNETQEYFVAPVSYTVYSSSTSSTNTFPDGAALSRARVAGYKVVWTDASNVTYTSGNTTTNNPWRWHALEMVYYVCVNTYSVRVDNGTATTKILSSTYDVVIPEGDENQGVKINCTTPSVVSGAAQFTDCVQDDRNSNLGLLTLRSSSSSNSTTTGGGQRTFTADIRSLTLLAKSITQDSTGIWAWDGMDHMVVAAGGGGLPTLADAVYGFMSDDRGDEDSPRNHSNGSSMRGEGTNDLDLQSQSLRLHNVVSNLAVSITNGIRSIPAYKSTPNSFPVVGTVLSPETFIRVQWVWLSFLVVQLAASVVLLVCTILTTRRIAGVPVVKSSALATLFALPEGQDRWANSHVSSVPAPLYTNTGGSWKESGENHEGGGHEEEEENKRTGGQADRNCVPEGAATSSRSSESRSESSSNELKSQQYDDSTQLEAQRRPVLLARRDTSMKVMKHEAKHMMARMEGGAMVLTSHWHRSGEQKPVMGARENTTVNMKCQKEEQ